MIEGRYSLHFTKYSLCKSPVVGKPLFFQKLNVALHCLRANVASTGRLTYLIFFYSFYSK